MCEKSRNRRREQFRYKIKYIAHNTLTIAIESTPLWCTWCTHNIADKLCLLDNSWISDTETGKYFHKREIIKFSTKVTSTSINHMPSISSPRKQHNIIVVELCSMHMAVVYLYARQNVYISTCCLRVNFSRSD